jgi:hypothetical protein
MAKLSKLKEYSPELYSEFLGEVLKVEGDVYLNECIMRDMDMLGAVVFRHTDRGVDYWWNVVDKIKENESEVK